MSERPTTAEDPPLRRPVWTPLGPVLFEAAVGEAVAGEAGGALAHAEPLPLEDAFRLTLEVAGLPVVSFQLHGPGAASAVVLVGDVYWPVRSRVPDGVRSSRRDQDDWLFGDLLEQVGRIRRGEA